MGRDGKITIVTAKKGGGGGVFLPCMTQCECLGHWIHLRAQCIIACSLQLQINSRDQLPKLAFRDTSPSFLTESVAIYIITFYIARQTTSTHSFAYALFNRSNLIHQERLSESEKKIQKLHKSP